MNAVLWMVQGLLALLFLMSGVRKLRRTDAQTRAVYWVRDTPVRVVRGIAVLEILGAIGLILPALTSILPWLTPLAAVGLVCLMLGAAWVNLRVKAYLPLLANIIVILLAGFTAYGRLVLAAA